MTTSRGRPGRCEPGDAAETGDEGDMGDEGSVEEREEEKELKVERLRDRTDWKFGLFWGSEKPRLRTRPRILEQVIMV